MALSILITPLLALLSTPFILFILVLSPTFDDNAIIYLAAVKEIK